jgi:tetratricopeptide (TPR) repeat protein
MTKKKTNKMLNNFRPFVYHIPIMLLAAANFAVTLAGDIETGRLLLQEGNINGAARYFTSAYNSDSMSADAVMAYASILTDGDLACALYLRVAHNDTAPAAERGESAKRLGDAAYCRGNYKEAYEWYDKSIQINPDSSCLPLLERTTLAIGKSSAGKAGGTTTLGHSSLPAAGASSEGKKRYVLQVGAFSSVENARKLYTRLKPQFSDITISAASQGDRTIHRVRIGSFPDQGSAEAFGEQQVKTKGLAYSIVKR